MRRHFLITAALLLYFNLIPPFISSSGVIASNHKTIGETFLGEELSYKMGFWLFDGVAKANLKIYKDDKGYVATLTASTTGAADWLQHREDTYISRFEEIEGGTRLRTISFEENKIIGKKKSRMLTVLDYKKRLVTWERWKNGKEKKTGTIEIPKGVFYDCPLTAFYNFRYGVYGKAEEGKEFTIRSFPKDKPIDIMLKIVSEAEMKAAFKDNVVNGYLAKVNLDKELFDSTSGEMEILFADGLVPIKAVAKDIVFFGDIRGELVDRK